ncbi:MAG: hypothetical protein K0B08_02170 [Bacteroidales bacterium]|nr:hypothetical protein [Bacteroidales bacterium]
MDTKKFEYLETIRETIETGDYEELDEFVEDIRERVKHDPDFNELFAEIKSRKYGDVIHLIDEFIYQDMQFHSGSNDEEEILNHLNGLALDPPLPEDISFEEFHEEDFSSVSSQDEDL